MVASMNFVIAFQAMTCASLLSTASASSFLKARTEGPLGEVTRELIAQALAAELGASDSAQLRGLEAELGAMYASLPKNEHGNLEPSAVRYALHRYFVQKHGWYIKGLEPNGQGWHSSGNVATVMTSRVPAYIQGLFEERVHGQGLQLHDLAVFAATLGDFVHNEALSDVMDLYKAFHISTATPADKQDVDKVIKAYVLQLLDSNFTIRSLHDLHDTDQYMLDDFPNWGDFQAWVADVRLTMAFEKKRTSFSTPAAAGGYVVDQVVEEAKTLADRLGAFQDIECRTLKGGLADIEYKSTGRILLSDFYRVGLGGDFLFIEHTDYLRKLGALDESDPGHPSVIIPNYLASQANCLASTSFHTVCCIDECEGLLGHLERAIAAPTASVGEIAELVAGLHSDTVNAPRNLSASLLDRLGEIAVHHDGVVPLHGRLFAQWMHHAYPLECPFPHEAGTISPITPDEWMDEFGADRLASPEHERRHHVMGQRKKAAEGIEPQFEGPSWLATEELVVPQWQRRRQGSGLLRKLAALLAVVGVALPITRLAMAAVASPKAVLFEKSHLV